MLFGIRAGMRAVAAAPLLFSVVMAAACTSSCKRDEPRKDPAPSMAGSSSQPASAPASITLAPAQGELATLLQAEATKARARNLKPFAELRADWCGPCKELEASMEDPRMADAFIGTYLIRLDADAWGGKLGAAGLDSGSIPAFFEIGDDGKPTGRKITGGAWAANVPANMAPPLKAFFKGK